MVAGEYHFRLESSLSSSAGCWTVAAGRCIRRWATSMGTGRWTSWSCARSTTRTLPCTSVAGDWTSGIAWCFKRPIPHGDTQGLEVTDFDLDGDLDLLITNGDGFDAGGLLQPFHGVQLLLNKGDGHFMPQPLMPFRGAHRAEAGDIDGDGDLDIAACAFHPFLPDDKPVEQKTRRRGLV